MTASSATVLGEAVAKMPLLGSLPRAAAGVSAASWGALMAGMSAGVKREVSEAEVQVPGQRKAGPQPIAGGGIREARVAGGRPAAGKPGAPEEPRRAKTERSTGAQAVARTMAGPGAAQQTAAAAVAPEAVPIGTGPGRGAGRVFGSGRARLRPAVRKAIGRKERGPNRRKASGSGRIWTGWSVAPTRQRKTLWRRDLRRPHPFPGNGPGAVFRWYDRTREQKPGRVRRIRKG